MRNAIGLCGVLLLVAVGAAADVVELRDGRSLEGRFRGATQQAVRFETGGVVQVIPVAQIVAVTFQPEPGPAAGVEPAPPADRSLVPSVAPTAAPSGPGQAIAGGSARPAPPAARQEPAIRRIELPAGTRLRVRLQDSLDPRQSTEGDRFAGFLDGALVTGETTLVPARAPVYGRVSAASPTGPPLQRLRLELTSLQVSGAPVEIVTGNQEGVGGAGVVTETDSSGRIASGSLLEFRLLQSAEWSVEAP
ncbi:MAG: hypothetical protein AAF430_08140 [Myxococcota bacterium]